MTSLRSMTRNYIERCVAQNVKALFIEDIHPGEASVYLRARNGNVDINIGQPGRDKAPILKVMTEKALADMATGTTVESVLERLFKGAYDVDAREECAIMADTDLV